MTMPAFKSYLLILAFCQSAIVRCLYEPYGENVALNKPASQSSTYVEGRFMFNASLGVDGKTSTNFNRDKTCSHTGPWHTSAWWTVNLNGLFFIKFIRIYQLIGQNVYNRLDGSNMYVQVEDRTWQNIQFNSSWPPEIIDVNVNLDKRISSIKLNNTKLSALTGETFISICELQAYEVVDCGDPTGIPDHSEVIITPGIAGYTTYNATLTIRCNEGCNYSLQSVEPVRCGGNGSWRGSLGNCNVIHCGEFAGVPGKSSISSKVGLAGNTSYNATITIKCNAGFRYTHPGKDTVRCNADGKWTSILGTCEVIICEKSIQNANHGSLIILEGIKGNISYNTSVSLICEDGYHLQGRGLIRCNGSGQWEGDLGTCSDRQQDHCRNDDHQQVVLPIAILVPLCLILIVTNTVTCLQLRRYAGFEKRHRENISSDVIIAQNFPSGINAYPMTGKTATISHRVDESKSERTHIDTLDSHSQSAGVYDELQRNIKETSEYDELKFKRETSLKMKENTLFYQNT